MHFCTTTLKTEAFDNFLQYIEIRERLIVKLSLYYYSGFVFGLVILLEFSTASKINGKVEHTVICSIPYNEIYGKCGKIILLYYDPDFG